MTRDTFKAKVTAGGELRERLLGLADALDKRRYPDNAALVREAAAALNPAIAPAGGVPYGWIEPETGNFVDHTTKLAMPFDASTFTLAVYTALPAAGNAVVNVTEEMIARGVKAIAPPVIRGESTYRSTVIDILTAALAAPQAVSCGGCTPPVYV